MRGLRPSHLQKNRPNCNCTSDQQASPPHPSRAARASGTPKIALPTARQLARQGGVTVPGVKVSGVSWPPHRPLIRALSGPQIVVAQSLRKFRGWVSPRFGRVGCACLPLLATPSLAQFSARWSGQLDGPGWGICARQMVTFAWCFPSPSNISSSTSFPSPPTSPSRSRPFQFLHNSILTFLSTSIRERAPHRTLHTSDQLPPRNKSSCAPIPQPGSPASHAVSCSPTRIDLGAHTLPRAFTTS
jgi:hypothetical protein